MTDPSASTHISESAAPRSHRALLADERDLLAVMMEHTPEAHLMYLDADFNFVMVNSTYAAGCGHTRDELLGRNHFELFPNEENEAIFRRVRDRAKPIVFKAKPFEFENLPERGVTYWDWTLTPVSAENGDVQGLVCSMIDVTERVRRQRLAETLVEFERMIHSSLDVQGVLRSLLHRAADAVGCESAIVLQREGDGWRAVSAHGALKAIAEGQFYTDEQVPVAAMAARRRRAAVFDDVSIDANIERSLAGFGIKSLCKVPLFIRNEVGGILGFHYHTKAVAFPRPVVEFAERLAASASLALTNAQLYQDEHRVAEVLRDILVRPVPDIPGLDLGVVYRSAHDASNVGGDFYDVFELDDARIAVLIGDVSGKGLHAASVTETVRSAARALAYLDPSPAAVLTRLNDALRRQLDSGTFVTALFAVIDPVSGEATIAGAGHPAPVLCGETPRFVDVPIGVVLGAFEAEYEEVRLTLGREVLLLYTDGVTEVRRGRAMFGQGRLLRTIKGCHPHATPDHVVATVLKMIAEHGRDKLTDDVVMLALRRSAIGQAAASSA